MTGPLQASAPEPEDTGHLLPADYWAAVVAGAEVRAAQLPRPVTTAEDVDRDWDASFRPTTGGGLARPLTAIDRVITARSHGGAMPGGPRLGVIHDAETPLAVGYAYSIAANWFATKATTSATVMVDPAETIRLLPDDVVAYHVGPAANGFTVGVEQAGYASLSRAQWTTPLGLAQMVRVASYMRDCRDRWGLPLRWATPAQIRAAKAGGAPQGWCLHDDIRAVLGGTTHTDPRPNYPAADLMNLANQGTGDELMALADDILASARSADRRAKHLELMVSSVGKYVVSIDAKVSKLAGVPVTAPPAELEPLEPATGELDDAGADSGA